MLRKKIFLQKYRSWIVGLLNSPRINLEFGWNFIRFWIYILYWKKLILWLHLLNSTKFHINPQTSLKELLIFKFVTYFALNKQWNKFSKKLSPQKFWKKVGFNFVYIDFDNIRSEYITILKEFWPDVWIWKILRILFTIQRNNNCIRPRNCNVYTKYQNVLSGLGYGSDEIKQKSWKVLGEQI